MSLVAPPRRPARAEAVAEGLWRLRLPLVWDEIPSANAWAIDDGRGGCVLVDCGMDGPGLRAELAAALGAAGWRLDQVSLLCVTHCHGDHYGLAGPVVDASGAELWMHPDHGHLTAWRDDLDGLAAERRERGARAGVPSDAIALCGDVSEEAEGVARTVPPDRPLVDGVEVASALGPWRVIETPGHAPSHVCLHQPERGLVISGDYVLPARPYLDPAPGDPLGQYLDGLERIDALRPRMLLPGHGRASSDPAGEIAAHRATVQADLDRLRAALESGPRSPWGLILALWPAGSDLERTWMVPTMLGALAHLERRGAAARDEQRGVALWRAA